MLLVFQSVTPTGNWQRQNVPMFFCAFYTLNTNTRKIVFWGVHKIHFLKVSILIKIVNKNVSCIAIKFHVFKKFLVKNMIYFGIENDVKKVSVFWLIFVSKNVSVFWSIFMSKKVIIFGLKNGLIIGRKKCYFCD